MTKKTFLLVTSYLLFVTMSGCGYTTRSMISDKYRTIYITPFENKIDITSETATQNKYRVYRPLLESDVTKAVSNKYLFDGNLKPVRAETADLTLKGQLVEFRRDPLRYTDSDEVAEYRINIVVNISVWDNKENRLLWQENQFTGDYTYFTSASSSPAAIAEATAVTNAIDDLARRIVERTVEEW